MDSTITNSVTSADDTKLTGDEGLTREQRMARWLSKRPPIDHLKDGCVALPDGTVLPLFNVGDRIVVDVRTHHLQDHPWLETIVGRVTAIDDDTGHVKLVDDDSDPRCPKTRYVTFKGTLQTFKLAPAKGDPFVVTSPTRSPEKTPRLDKDGNPKKGRGRPRGSKNKPKAQGK